MYLVRTAKEGIPFISRSLSLINFFNLASAVTLSGGKAYLESTTDLKPAAQAKVSILFMDAEPTGINDVRVTTPEAQGETYNLGGQRVGNGYKGIVIVNGKKVLK